MFLENPLNFNEQFGRIEVICGSMFSGKTEELIRRLKRAELAKQKTRIFKPMVDKRHNNDYLTSHDLNQINSTSVNSASNIYNLANDFNVIGIDEAQFFDKEIVEVCNNLADDGKRIIVAGLDMDFEGKPFGSMPQLMAIAEYVTKLHAICTRSGNLANYSFRKSNNKNLILIGEKKDYEPLSRVEFLKAIKNLKK